MSTDQRERLEWVLAEIKRDCINDVEAREGAELTGKNVAKWLGEIQAQISALASVLAVVVAARAEAAQIEGAE